MKVISAVALVAMVAAVAHGAEMMMMMDEEVLALRQTNVHSNINNLTVCPDQVTDGTKYCRCADTVLDVSNRSNIKINGNGYGFLDSVDSVNQYAGTASFARNAAEYLLGDPAVTNITLLGASVINPEGMYAVDYRYSLGIMKAEYGFNGGLVLSTGDARVFGSYRRASSPTSGQERVTSAEGVTFDPRVANSRDCTDLKFTFRAEVALDVSLEYVFLSQEYPEFVDNIFNDVFSLTIVDLDDPSATPVDLAKIGGQTENFDVSVNSINYKKLPGLFELCDVTQQFDGFTKNLKANAYPLEAGKTYEVSLLVCDVSDTLYDSAVVLKSGSFAKCSSSVASIVCPPTKYDICLNNELPEASAQTACGSVNVVRDNSTECTLGPETTSCFVKYFVEGFPDLQCAYEAKLKQATVESNWKISRSDKFTSVENGCNALYPGVSYSVAGSIDDPCCLSGGVGTVSWGDGATSTFAFGALSPDFKVSHVYSESFLLGQAGNVSVSVSVVDCQGLSSPVETKNLPRPTCDGSGVEINAIQTRAVPYLIETEKDENVSAPVLIGMPDSCYHNCGYTYTYDWGDGTPVETGEVDSSFIIVAPNHVYSTCGNFTIKVQLLNNAGQVVSFESGDSLVSTLEVAIVVLSCGECPGVECEDGFVATDANGCTCTKTCSSNLDCILGGVCSGLCLSNGFCENGALTCPRGCCKATPGRIPGVLDSAICSNGCGRANCCFENIENGCNALNREAELVETCTALYGANVPCDTDADCVGQSGLSGARKCIDVNVASIDARLCSAQCATTADCPVGKKCVAFTKSYNPPLNFCVSESFL
uniref:PKD domain-containing protein n=1 Tax=Erythrolobus australicus TaxID=1077150 RepID=A0A7S1XGM7_9RHOD|mmetsp:Transcript_2356/g.6368  ORF Transcript_2356/g.6368 Transcript_2356/m.6368 type:complete len:822 (+) Transcript_2356:829-3294(+)|eukprot:CAMPEP_0185829508 /NCGR_PEP_ID=MMETSP1353-20130828/291_1 /TAXON_ID=1077150 /ORGANISM="Erythrolobus australicus, Strain CCMP3124" /LENGTH=821 /DNA_ID=CAMNT_0028527309 /DNA_START=825 /DNA_END=3290 /DNA_ORIENTATION=+